LLPFVYNFLTSQFQKKLCHCQKNVFNFSFAVQAGDVKPKKKPQWILRKSNFLKHLSSLWTVKKGLWDLMGLMIESMMKTERYEFLSESEGNKGNSFRRGRIYGQGRVLEFRVPFDR
jgi:hypothetical protein